MALEFGHRARRRQKCGGAPGGGRCPGAHPLRRGAGRGRGRRGRRGGRERRLGAAQPPGDEPPLRRRGHLCAAPAVRRIGDRGTCDRLLRTAGRLLKGLGHKAVFRLRRYLGLLGAVAILPLAACGEEDDPDPPDQPPAELLREAAANPATSGEAEIDLSIRLDGSSLLAGTTTVELSGPFELVEGGLPRFDFAVDAEVAGFGVDGALVSTGDDAFVVFFGENYRVGTERVAAITQRLGAAGAGSGSAGLGLDVAGWFEQPRYAGSEEVGGAETERIEATLRSDAAARDLAELASALGAPGALRALAAGAEPGPAEAWIALEDETIRRLRVQFPFTVPPAQRAAARGIGGGAVSLDAEIADVGTEVEIEPPPGGGFQPIEQLIARLRDLASLGGL